MGNLRILQYGNDDKCTFNFIINLILLEIAYVEYSGASECSASVGSGYLPTNIACFLFYKLRVTNILGDNLKNNKIK